MFWLRVLLFWIYLLILLIISERSGGKCEYIICRLGYQKKKVEIHIRFEAIEKYLCENSYPTGIMWRSKTRVTSYELQVQIHELRVKIYNLRVQITQLEHWKHELEEKKHELAD